MEGWRWQRVACILTGRHAGILSSPTVTEIHAPAGGLTDTMVLHWFWGLVRMCVKKKIETLSNSWITLLLRMRISYQLHLLLFLLSREWKWRDTSFRVFPLGLDPIPQRTSQIDIQPCLSVTHTGGSDTDASFLTASVKFHLQKSLGTIKQKPNGKQGTITELVIAA